MLTGKLPGIHGAYFAPDEGAGGGGSETGETQEQDWMADIELNLGEDFGKQKGSTSFGTGDDNPKPDDATNKDGDGDDAGKKLADEQEAKKKVEAEELAQKQAKEKEEADKKKLADDKEQETSTIRQMRKTIRALQKEVKGLKEPDKDKPKEPEFTEEELLKIMEEHDDGSIEGKKVLLNVMKYMRDQGIKSAEKASIAVAKREKIAQNADTFFSGVYHDYDDEDFDERLDTEFPEEEWELNGHPHSKRLRAALTIIAQLPKLRETWVEDAVSKAKTEFETSKANRQTEEATRRTEEATKKDAIERARKAEIAKRGLPKSSTGGEKAQPTEKVARVAKELQLSPSAARIYAGFVGNK